MDFHENSPAREKSDRNRAPSVTPAFRKPPKARHPPPTAEIPDAVARPSRTCFGTARIDTESAAPATKWIDFPGPILSKHAALDPPNITLMLFP